jgi:hypothetical protein
MSRRGRESLFPRVEVPECSPLLAILERTEDRVWLSRTVVCDRHTVRGVPGKRMDVIVEQGIAGGPALVEVIEKTGRFDGSTRPRICVRRCDPSIPALPGTIEARWETDSVGIVLTRQAGTPWTWCDYPLRADLRDYSPARLVSWHWARYYQIIPWPEAEALAESFSVFPGETLAEANRRASRELYRLARDLGWRKLTTREQGKLGLTGQWHREEICAARMADRAYPRDGVGQWTHEAARPE